MLATKDYSAMTLEELVSAEKKLLSEKTLTAAIIGGLIGIAVYSATHKGFILTVILLISAYLISSRHSKNLKDVQAEISRRN